MPASNSALRPNAPVSLAAAESSHADLHPASGPAAAVSGAESAVKVAAGQDQQQPGPPNHDPRANFNWHEPCRQPQSHQMGSEPQPLLVRPDGSRQIFIYPPHAAHVPGSYKPVAQTLEHGSLNSSPQIRPDADVPGSYIPAAQVSENGSLSSSPQICLDAGSGSSKASSSSDRARQLCGTEQPSCQAAEALTIAQRDSSCGTQMLHGKAHPSALQSQWKSMSEDPAAARPVGHEQQQEAWTIKKSKSQARKGGSAADKQQAASSVLRVHDASSSPSAVQLPTNDGLVTEGDTSSQASIGSSISWHQQSAGAVSHPAASLPTAIGTKPCKDGACACH